jgi:hypothetical protein
MADEARIVAWNPQLIGNCFIPTDGFGARTKTKKM